MALQLALLVHLLCQCFLKVSWSLHRAEVHAEVHGDVITCSVYFFHPQQTHGGSTQDGCEDHERLCAKLTEKKDSPSQATFSRLVSAGPQTEQWPRATGHVQEIHRRHHVRSQIEIQTVESMGDVLNEEYPLQTVGNEKSRVPSRHHHHRKRRD